MNELRPTRFSNIIGQKEVIKRLKINVQAAKKRKQLLGHTLFDGPLGLGKTTLAGCIAIEFGVSFVSTIGPVFTSVGAATEFFTSIKKNSVVFIDEIHQIPKAVQEYLYPILEDGFLEMKVGYQSITLDLPPMTIVGATTDSGKMAAPFRDRFPNRCHLEYYTEAELNLLVRKNAKVLGLMLESGVSQYIASMARSTPRIANNRLYWVRDWADSCKTARVTLKLVQQAFEQIGLDEAGMEKVDREVLKAMTRIFFDKPVGIKSLASAIGKSEVTVEEEIEPWLVRCELLCRSPRGRMLTEKGREYVRTFS